MSMIHNSKVYQTGFQYCDIQFCKSQTLWLFNLKHAHNYNSVKFEESNYLDLEV